MLGLHEGMGWWMIFGGLWMVAFWGIVIGLIVWGIRTLGDKSERRHDESAMVIAEERYANGEITRDQFEEIKHTLRS